MLFVSVRDAVLRLGFRKHLSSAMAASSNSRTRRIEELNALLAMSTADSAATCCFNQNVCPNPRIDLTDNFAVNSNTEPAMRAA